MQRHTIPLILTVLAEDDVDHLDLRYRIESSILQADTLKNVHGIHHVESIGSGQAKPGTETARPGTCKVGPHPFYAPLYFPGHRPVPDICPSHAASEHHAQVVKEHSILFTEVTRLTGLTPMIWHSGGGTMTIVIPLTDPAPGEDWSFPCYMGLEEGRTDENLWYGSFSFYSSDEHHEAGGLDIVHEDEPQHPHEWARRIAEHYHNHVTHQQPQADPPRP